MRFLRLIVLIFCISLICTSCSLWNLAYEIQEKKYYSNKKNFVSVKAECVEITTNEWSPGKYFITVKNMEYERTDDCKFISRTFVVNKANSTILKNNGIEEKLAPGTIFVFISAPEYFGDGYKCPIVGIEIDGEILLDFDTGYKNLMATYY